MNVSNCCQEPVYQETDICSKCKEHCEVIDLDEVLENENEYKENK